MDPEKDQDPRDDQALDPTALVDAEESDQAVSEDGAAEPETTDDPLADLPEAVRRRLTEAEQRAAEYESRFKGLQPVVQREVEARRREQQLREQYEAQIAQYRIATLPEEQQAGAWAAYQQELTLRQLQMQRQQEQQTMETVLKGAVINDIVARYNLPAEQRELLARFPDPDLMEDYAKQIAAARSQAGRRQSRRQRQAQGKDRFEGGGSPQAAGKPPKTFDEAMQRLNGYKFVME